MNQDEEGQIKFLLSQFKKYLDDRKVGIRKFASICGMTRARLEKIFSAKVSPTTEEINTLNDGILAVKSNYERAQSLEQLKEYKAQVAAQMKEALTEMGATEQEMKKFGLKKISIN